MPLGAAEVGVEPVAPAAPVTGALGVPAVGAVAPAGLAAPAANGCIDAESALEQPLAIATAHNMPYQNFVAIDLSAPPRPRIR
jgi:hypothetical protein